MTRRPSPDEWSSATKITCEKARALSSRLGPLAVFRENRTYKCPTIKEHLFFSKGQKWIPQFLILTIWYDYKATAQNHEWPGISANNNQWSLETLSVIAKCKKNPATGPVWPSST